MVNETTFDGLPLSICGYCRRKLPQGRDGFCSDVCKGKALQVAANLQAIEDGRLCKNCRRPLPARNRVYCSDACAHAKKATWHVCPWCKSRYMGRKLPGCSPDCRRKIRVRKALDLKDQQWAAARFDQPDLVTVQQLTVLCRRPLRTNSGRTVIIRLWSGPRLAEFPADPEFKVAIWRDETNIYAQARKWSEAHEHLKALTNHQIRLLPIGRAEESPHARKRR